MKVTKNKCMPHHWILPRPNGTTSRGVCRYCGSEKDFFNFIDYGTQRSPWQKKNEITWEDKQRNSVDNA